MIDILHAYTFLCCILFYFYRTLNTDATRFTKVLLQQQED